MNLTELMTGVTPDASYEGWVTNDDMVFAIDLTPGETPATLETAYAVVQMGIEGLDAQLNPVTQDKQYIRAGQSTMKTGTQRTFKVTGDKYIGDEAQDFMLSHAVKYGTGNGVVTNYVYFNILTGKGEKGQVSIIVNSDEWANLRPETGDGGDTSEYIDYSKLNRGKGLTYEQRYGEEKAKELRKFRSKTLGKNSSSRKGKTLVELYGQEKAAEITEANRVKSLGRKTPHKSETKLKISAARMGYKNPTFCCLVCRKELGINNFTQHQNTHLKKETVQE